MTSISQGSGGVGGGGTQAATAWRSVLDAVVEVTAGSADSRLPPELEASLIRLAAGEHRAATQADYLAIIKVFVASFLGRMPLALSPDFSTRIAGEILAEIQEHPEMSPRLEMLWRKMQERSA